MDTPQIELTNGLIPFTEFLKLYEVATTAATNTFADEKKSLIAQRRQVINDDS